MGHYLVAVCACLRKRPCWIPTCIVHEEKENTAHHKDVESFQHCELTWHKECHPWGIAYHRVLASKCIKSSAILKPVLLTYDCIEVFAKCVLEQCRTSCMKCISAQKEKNHGTAFCVVGSRHRHSIYTKMCQLLHSLNLSRGISLTIPSGMSNEPLARQIRFQLGVNIYRARSFAATVLFPNTWNP